MKLIDILVGSGDGMSLFGLRTKYLAMDPDGRVYGYTEMPTPGIIVWSVPDNLHSTDGRGCLIQIDPDDVDGKWHSAIITREQYEAALAAKNSDWIEWGGGECPVPRGTLVDVRYRDGRQLNALSANDGTLNPRDASFVFWRNDGSENDIIAYRLHQPQKAEQAEADEEADMNECIGQDAAPVWNGEGLPPVGCECEFMKHTLDAISNWRRGIIKYVSEYTVVIVEALSPGEFVAHPRTCDFRPIRSEADKKREDALDAIYGAIASAEREHNRSDEADKVYEAIAAGKIPGVKLED
ncbi:hypothetical protein WM027_17640 [Klebsiella pneumoniae]